MVYRARFAGSGAVAGKSEQRVVTKDAAAAALPVGLRGAE